MPEIELKPCPFCGGEAVAEICNDLKELRIFCESCPAEISLSFEIAGLDDGSCISFSEMRKAMDTLTDFWNVRATDENET